MGPTFGFLGVPVIWLAFMFFLLVTAAFGGLQSFSVPVLGGIYGIWGRRGGGGPDRLPARVGGGHGGRRLRRRAGACRMIAPWAPRWSAPRSVPRCWPAACCRPGA
jgi:hypothetical protein